MKNATPNTPDPEILADEARRAENKRFYVDTENIVARFLYLKAKQMLARQEDEDETGGAMREVGNAVLSITRIKEMNDKDLKPGAGDDRAAIERKRADYIARVDKLLAEIDREEAAQRNTPSGADADSQG